MDPATRKSETLGCNPCSKMFNLAGSLITGTGRAIKVTATTIGSTVKKVTLFTFHLFTCGCFKKTPQSKYKPQGSYGSQASAVKYPKIRSNHLPLSDDLPGIVSYPINRSTPLVHTDKKQEEIAQLKSANKYFIDQLLKNQIEINQLKAQIKEKDELLDGYKKAVLAEFASE